MGLPEASPHGVDVSASLGQIAGVANALGLEADVNSIDAIGALSVSQLSQAMNQGKAAALAAIAAKARAPLNFVPNAPPAGENEDEGLNPADVDIATEAEHGPTGEEGPAGAATAGLTAADVDTATAAEQGETGGDGGGAAGGDCLIASWAMNGLRVPEQDQRREFFEAFYRYWLRKYPKSGKRQVRKYQLIARRLIERVARRGPTEVRAAQQLIFERVIAPTGATLEPNEFEGAYQRLRAVMEDLVQRHGLELDPADIPHPADEIMARMREERRRVRPAVSD
jgi:hypothetical protein